ncbi:3730_t:CDS:2 [Funneliformis mosseae]|uniref:RNA helicase n=1 Tax=Funneliformis mosseae TaxID=27381 RepID=A0A9N9F582_FUNMO|nr:3730_t:CDS:2 [Funneliformis mosseae]
MFVPRAVKRTGPVSKIHNKKPKTIIYDSEISKESTAENLDLVVQDKQKNVTQTESINLDEKDETTSVKQIREITQLTDQQISLEVEHMIVEPNTVDQQELDKYSPRIIVNGQVPNSQDQEIVVIDEHEEAVKEYSNQQRTAVAGEPICVICGKYGEYICDETDHDVCSLECKKVDIERVKNGGKIQRFSLKETQTKIEVETPISGLFHVQLTGYTLPTDISSLTGVQIQNILKRNKINVQGKNIPPPILSFSQCKLPTRMMENLQTEGYTQPTSIQMQIVPTALIGRDILASGQTGTGKTASFLIPIISHCWSLSQCYEGKNGPYAIILAPTRELCSQIENLTKGLIRGLTNMKTSLLVGGLPIPNQVHRLKQGTQIAIATPGRLIDILNQSNEELSMNNIHMFVLDEVDMMFKMGFEKQVREIIDKLPLPITSARRQTLMISATFPKIIEKLANSLLKDHIRIIVGAQLDNNKDPENSRLNFIPCIPVKQTILWIENKSKKKQLFSILNDPKYYNPPIVIFVESKMGADLLSQAIEKKCNVRSVSMHGDKSQGERMMILQSFLNGDYDVIVSTGVLSRGLNLPDVEMVINFDMAVSVDEYVHQVGRASGSGNSGNSSGWAITFINEDHKHLFKEFVQVLNAQPSGKVTPLPSKLLVHGCTLYGNNRSSSNKK